MRLWVSTRDTRIIAFSEPENNSEYVFCMSLDYFIGILEEVRKVHETQGDARECKAVANIIKGFKELGNA